MAGVAKKRNRNTATDNSKAKANARPAETLTEDGMQGMVRITSKFAAINRLLPHGFDSYSFHRVLDKLKREDISRYLANPKKFEKELREAVRYIYGASPHFRRLIQYFVGLSDLVYLVEPYRIDPKTTSVKRTNLNYRRVLNVLSSMNLKTQLPKILTVCLREDVYYGTMWVHTDCITFQQLPSDYCRISSCEDNVFNVSFDFSFFDGKEHLLDFYPPEFRQKYQQYRARISEQEAKEIDARRYKHWWWRYRWIELDSPTSFAIKCNSDIPEYAIPPFAGILREIFDIDDFKELKLTKTALENYAMVAMTIPLDKDKGWGIDFDKAKEFWQNLDAVLPEEVGSVLTPMPLSKISFERSNASDDKTVAEAEQNLFTAAGVSSLLFNNEKASANALLLSIKADQTITYGIVKSIGDALNRHLHSLPYGKNFRINMLDISPYNRKEMGDAYLKAATYGIPTISAYAASQGIGQAELDAMSFLEGQVLRLQDIFRPIQSSSQMNADDLEKKGATEQGGAPQKDIGELTDSGEQSAEDRDDW